MVIQLLFITLHWKYLNVLFLNNIICKKKYVPGGWNGYKELVVTKKVKESNEITSFYFNTVNGEPLPKFKPGQYLSLRLPKGTFSSTGKGYAFKK